METKTFDTIDGKLRITRSKPVSLIETISYEELLMQSKALDDGYAKRRAEMDENLAQAKGFNLDKPTQAIEEIANDTGGSP